LEKICVRCTCMITSEECYLLFRAIYCRACMNTIENDPEYAHIFSNKNVFAALEDIKQIEN